ncbi:Ku protein [Paenibacillus agilis]|uniref:Non-homologous end joining protein Ku n=1 Tax=Paenibacillus agilis TaxID=3020863 RepID=A0A559IW58_9BACL|nr:Ku protein [Paenibacillus agilis]
MHTVWKGAISFGLVHVPVKMHTATEDKDISLRMIHNKCGSPLSYIRECPVCDTEVPWNDIVKGYEYETGHFVLFSKDELDALQEEASRSIAIQDFVDLQDIDPIYYQKTYYLSPDQAGTNAYQLLREALRLTNKIGIARVTLRAKSSLAAIRVIDNCLVMETMHFPDEIRASGAVPNVPAQVQVNDKELEMAKLLIDQLSTSFEPHKYKDEYRERLLSRIEQKIAGREVKAAPQLHQETPIVDLMAALQASIQATKPGMMPAMMATDTGVPAAGAQSLGAAGAAASTSSAAKPRRRRAAAGTDAVQVSNEVPMPSAPAMSDANTVTPPLGVGGAPLGGAAINTGAESVSAGTASPSAPAASGRGRRRRQATEAAPEAAASTTAATTAPAAATGSPRGRRRKANAAPEAATGAGAVASSASAPAAHGMNAVSAGPVDASAQPRSSRRRRMQAAEAAPEAAASTAAATDNAAKPARRTRRRKSEAHA